MLCVTSSASSRASARTTNPARPSRLPRLVSRHSVGCLDDRYPCLEPVGWPACLGVRMRYLRAPKVTSDTGSRGTSGHPGSIERLAVVGLAVGAIFVDLQIKVCRLEGKPMGNSHMPGGERCRHGVCGRNAIRFERGRSRSGNGPDERETPGPSARYQPRPTTWRKISQLIAANRDRANRSRDDRLGAAPR